MSHKARTQERRAAPPIYGYKVMTPAGTSLPMDRRLGQVRLNFQRFSATQLGPNAVWGQNR